MSQSELHAGLDTSVLLRLLTGRPPEQTAAALSFLAEVEKAGGKILVSNLVVAEAYFACQHHYRLGKQVVLDGLRELLSQPTFVIQSGLLELLSRRGLGRAKPGFVDRLIHSEYRAVGLPLVTFEKVAKRLNHTRLLAAGD